MEAITRWLRSLGAAGAAANAWQACEERRLEERRIDAFAGQLPPVETEPAVASWQRGHQ